jgi:hypothetical protein
MKLTTLIISLLLIACASKEDIVPTTIVGKWAPSYMLQTKNADGSWGNWETINTLVALPVIEFTSDGRYLTDGKPGANCCYAGNKYSISGNTIDFTERLSCPNVDCVAYFAWTIHFLKGDVLILETGNIRSKYTKTK